MLLLPSMLLHAQFNTVGNNTEPAINQKKKDSVFKKVELPKSHQVVSMPLDTIIVTSPYGMRIHPKTGEPGFHRGVDLRGKNVRVYSMFPSEVVAIDYNEKGGVNIELLTKGKDVYHVYLLHLSRIFVSIGDKVGAGWPIGVTGATGSSTAAHLHLGIKKNGKYINPIELIDTIHRLDLQDL